MNERGKVVAPTGRRAPRQAARGLLAALAVMALGVVVVSLVLGVALSHAFAAEPRGEETVSKVSTASSSRGTIAMAAAIAVAIGSLSAGYAVAHVGSAAIGAASEKPEMLGRSLVFAGLAEGIAIFGFVVAIMLMRTM